jgi:hypothetical protein
VLRSKNAWIIVTTVSVCFEGNLFFILSSAFISARNTELSNCPDLLLANEDTELGEEEKELLDIYHHSFNDENVDMDLLMTLLCDINTSQDKGKSL